MVLFYHYQLSITDPIFLESRKYSRESLFVSYEHYISADYRILSISYLSLHDSFDRCFLVCNLVCLLLLSLLFCPLHD